MINNCYTFNELKEKFGWEGGPGEIKKQIRFAQLRGVEIEPAFKKGSTYFRIVLDTNDQEHEVWIPYPKHPNLEVSNKGRVKNILTNNYLGYVSNDGYMCFSYEGKQYKIHRVVLETFNPIAHSETMVVDHIDGIKTNNFLENLRWVTHEENTSFNATNRQSINSIINQMIQKLGYEKTTEALEHLSKILFLNS